MSAILEARLLAVETRLAALEMEVRRGGAAAPTSPAAGARPASGGGSSSGHSPDAVASDRMLDGPYGDPVVKKDPKRWVEQGGESYAGSTMSQCPSGYLEELASLHTWMADKDDENAKTYTDKHGRTQPASAYGRKMAALARGWARRNQGKRAAPDVGPNDNDASDDDNDIPF